MKSRQSSLVAALCIAATASCAVYEHAGPSREGGIATGGNANGGGAIDAASGAGGVGTAGGGVNDGSSALTSANNVATTAVDGLDKTSKVFLKMNTPPLDAEADMTSFDPTGFTVNWTTNDAIAAQIGFWALGAP